MSTSSFFFSQLFLPLLVRLYLLYEHLFTLPLIPLTFDRTANIAFRALVLYNAAAAALAAALANANLILIVGG